MALLRAVNLGARNTNVFIERQVGSRGTGRNWNTVLKLGALAEE